MATAGDVHPNSPVIRIRAYNSNIDLERVEMLEKICEAGPSGKVSLYTDLLGDPLGRVRNYPTYAMLVAEIDPEQELVGLIRAGVKEVARQRSLDDKHLGKANVNGSENVDDTVFTRTAYILGLRVSPFYRRMGVGLRLVEKMESWCREQGAEYVYIATEKDHEASVNLFTQKLAYTKFRTPTILLQPVYVKAKRLPTRMQVVTLNKSDAAILYRSLFGRREFFPKDIDDILKSKTNKGTWLAIYKGEGDPSEAFQRALKGDGSWAVLSVWRCNEIFKLEVRGVCGLFRGLAATSRLVGRALPWVTIPTFPDVFRPFGLQVLYGLHAQGEHGNELLEMLCWHAHNLAREEGCQLTAAEVGSCDPLRASIPNWSRISCEEDLWCIKRLAIHSDDQDWCKVAPTTHLFMDPRDF